MNYKIENTVAKLSSKHSGFFFLFVICLIILSKIFFVSDNSLIVIICFFLITTIGVSHGSLDNLKGEKLLKKYKIKHKFLFYLSYMFLAFVTVVIWNYLPFFTLLLFLAVASYHFGKEDTDLFLYTNYASRSVKSDNKYTKDYYFFTFFKGFFIIATPLMFNFNETKEIFIILDSNFSLHKDFILIFWCISFYSYIHFNMLLNSSTYGSWAVLTDGASILLLNYFFSPLIAFTLYFCFLHSVRHSILLIASLDKKNLKKGTVKFLKKALPLTLVTAVLFIVSVYFLTNYYVLDNAIIKVIFIGLASLTFPHILLEYLIEKNEKKTN
ncbi:Brp/Blh family beta-carotene 15,15'-dioxygenase [Candidatus Pelagibacter sp.]|nr:Brp/Blh family beta-carotene 15,15'-dioxygenase [Candidatus Pelagibacter sp.]